MSLYVFYVYRKPILSLTVITHVQYHCVKLIKKGEQLKKKYRLYTLIPFPNPPYPLLMLAWPGFTTSGVWNPWVTASSFGWPIKSACIVYFFFLFSHSSQREEGPSAWKRNCHLGVSNKIPEPGELSTTSGSSYNCPDMTRPYYFNTILKNVEIHLACCPVNRNTRFSKTI